MSTKNQNQNIFSYPLPKWGGLGWGIFLLLCLFYGTQGFAQSTSKHPDMVYVAGGTFRMGCTSEQSDCGDDEKPVHTVSVGSFFIGKYEVTNEQYAKFLNDYGIEVVKEGKYRGQLMVEEYNWGVYLDGDTWKPQAGYEKHPVVYVTWYGANAYCKHYGGRLPTEAEWEYAARGGQKSQGYTYSGGNAMAGLGWYADNSNGRTQRVGRRLSNELGIHDMSGNVWEWCLDVYDANYYSKSPSTDPIPAGGGGWRVLRGGSWGYGAEYCRVSNRNDSSHALWDFIHCGFRVVILP